MFGIGPMELALFLVIVLLVVGPEKLPAFMKAVGKSLRQVRNASREFKDAIGLDELLREGDPFRAPPIRPPPERPVPLETRAPESSAPEAGPAPSTEPAAVTPAAADAEEPAKQAEPRESAAEADAGTEAERS
jgi:TatA/E family protein of Tat protein translocase